MGSTESRDEDYTKSVETDSVSVGASVQGNISCSVIDSDQPYTVERTVQGNTDCIAIDNDQPHTVERTVQGNTDCIAIDNDQRHTVERTVQGNTDCIAIENDPIQTEEYSASVTEASQKGDCRKDLKPSDTSASALKNEYVNNETLALSNDREKLPCQFEKSLDSSNDSRNTGCCNIISAEMVDALEDSDRNDDLVELQSKIKRLLISLNNDSTENAGNESSKQSSEVTLKTVEESVEEPVVSVDEFSKTTLSNAKETCVSEVTSHDCPRSRSNTNDTNSRILVVSPYNPAHSRTEDMSSSNSITSENLILAAVPEIENSCVNQNCLTNAALLHLVDIIDSKRCQNHSTDDERFCSADQNFNLLQQGHRDETEQVNLVGKKDGDSETRNTQDEELCSSNELSGRQELQAACISSSGSTDTSATYKNNSSCILDHSSIVRCNLVLKLQKELTCMQIEISKLQDSMRCANSILQKLTESTFEDDN